MASAYAPEMMEEAEYRAAREKLESEFGRVNILVAGNTGVGKSTLINAVFGTDVAQAGEGVPVTQTISRYEAPDAPLNIYDTKGFEAGAGDAVGQVMAKLADARRSGDPTGHIHIAWLCIGSGTGRIEPVHTDFLQALADHGIPCIVVLTKAASDSMLETARHLAQPSSTIIEVNSVTHTPPRGAPQEPFGIEELIQQTYAIVPGGVKTAFAIAQKASWALKKTEARKVVGMAATAAVASAPIPVPGGHSTALIGIQIAMMAKIDHVYGLSWSDKGAGALKSIALAIASGAGKWSFAALVSEGLKASGVGYVFGAGIGGAIGGTLTTTIGLAYVEAAHRSAESGTAIAPEELINSILGAVRQAKIRPSAT